MRQVSFIALVSVLALFIGGCPTSEEESATTGSSPPTPVAVVPPSPQPTASQAPFSNPVTPQQQGRPQAVAGLVQTLPPGARRIPQGRSDPFAAFPLQPQVSVSPDAQGGGTNDRPVPQVPQLPPVGPNRGEPRVNQPRANRPRANQPRANQPRASRPLANRRPASRGNVLPSPRRLPPARSPIAAGPRLGSPSTPGASVPVPNTIPTLPKLPEPNLARGIQVTGVVEVGGVPHAIVTVPNEPSRYVRVGQRLSNGQVLVKRIDMRGPNPVVILEQYGIEVARRVGEPPAGGLEQPGSPTAVLPPSPPLSTNVPPQA